MKKLANNQDLYDYLSFLISELKERGAVELSEAVYSARCQCMPTEFIGESLLALRRVLREEHGILSKSERMDLMDVISQLDQALNRRA